MIIEKLCCVDGCDTPNNKVSLFGDKFYCDKHRKQMKRNGKITHIKAFKKPLPENCIVEGCTNKPVGNKMCSKHYNQFKKYGKLIETRYDRNEIVTYDTYAEIILKNKDLKEIGRVKIDIDIIDKIKEYKWHIISSGYAYCSVLKLLLHRYIMNLNKDDYFFIDHINRDKLDCRRCNLRISDKITNSQNQSIRKDNASGIIGVSKTKNGKWRAYIHKHQGENIKSKYIQIGTFNCKEEAIRNRLLAEIEYFGDFSPQKHLFEKYKLTP
jgi:hypothetical protein